MAGLTSFDELKDEVQAWLEREGDPALVERLDTIIQMSESWLNRKLKGYQREVSGSLTTDAAGKAALPAGFVSMVSMTSNGSRFTSYAVTGSDLYIAGGASRTFDVVYRSRLPALSDGTPTNWLLEIAPDAYLYACLSQASVFLENVQGAALYAGQAANILSELNLQSVAAQYGMASLTPAVRAP